MSDKDSERCINGRLMQIAAGIKFQSRRCQTINSGQTLDTEHFAVCLASNVTNCQLVALTMVIINS